jgi:hypothetical protein
LARRLTVSQAPGEPTSLPADRAPEAPDGHVIEVPAGRWQGGRRRLASPGD